MKEKQTNKETEKPKKKVARKSTRKVEMGWVHEGIQVRKRQGGGTRKFDIDRDVCSDGLIEYGKNLFFPEGISSKGKIEDFKFDILDFKETPLAKDISVEDCYELVKMGVVSFYLNSKKG